MAKMSIIMMMIKFCNLSTHIYIASWWPYSIGYFNRTQVRSLPYLVSHSRKPHFEKCCSHMGIAQIALNPPPQTGTVDPFFWAQFFHLVFNIAKWAKCAQTILASIVTHPKARNGPFWCVTLCLLWFFLKLSDLSSLLNGFLEAVTWICQNWYGFL